MMSKIAGVAINGPSSAGKSHFLKLLRDDARFAGCTISEMDDLRYWLRERRATRKQTKRWFSELTIAADPAVIKALRQNVVRSRPQKRTIKLQFCRLCVSQSPFVTVNPRHLRGHSEMRFFELLRQAFGVDVHQIALLSSVPRFALNLIQRWDRRWRRNVGEYLRIRRGSDGYALVVRNRLRDGMIVDAEAVLALLYPAASDAAE